MAYETSIKNFFYFLFFVLSSIFILSGNFSVDLGLPIVAVPGGCFLGSRCPLPFCQQYHHLHSRPSSFAEVICSLLSFTCPSSCFHCSFCAALPEQTSSTSAKVCTTLSHICHRGLAIASLSVRWPPPGGCRIRTRDLCHRSLALYHLSHPSPFGRFCDLT